MSARFWTACPTSAALLLAGVLTQSVAMPPEAPVQGQCPGVPAQSHLVPRVYAVADLVLPFGESASTKILNLSQNGVFTLSAPAADKTLEERLMYRIQDTIQPESWSVLGGPGKMEYYPLDMVLVVSQTPAAHEQIAELLAELRRQQAVIVAQVDVRCISVAEPVFECLARDFHIDVKMDSCSSRGEPHIVTQQCKPSGFISDCCPRSCETGVTPTGTCASRSTRLTLLNDDQLSQFLTAAQADPRTNILCTPRLQTVNGQAATLDIAQTQYFQTRVECFWNGEQVLTLPKSEPYTLGLQISVQPVVSADRRCVRLDLKANLTSLESKEVPLSPITSMVTPVYECGAQGAPVPFTQFIQTPKITKLALDKTLTIPDGGTVLLSGWTRPGDYCIECGCPLLSEIPYLNCFFKNARHEPYTEHVLLLVTSRIINDREGPCTAPAACPCPKPCMAEPATPPADATAQANAIRLRKRSAKDATRVPEMDAEEQEIAPRSQETSPGKEKKIAKLLEKYYQACADGRLAEAQKLAGRALILDPACFSKNRKAWGQENSWGEQER